MNMCIKPKYTKKQIENSIAYWTRQLHLMDETKSKIIDALVDRFGHDVVFSKCLDYDLNQADCETIFKVLNAYLFSNALKPIDILWLPEHNAIEILKQNAVRSGRPDKDYSNSQFYGAYTGVCKDIVDSYGNIVGIDISNESILMNSSRLTTCAFIFAVACICHEMIHYYDRFSQEFYDKQLHASQTDTDFNSHKDKAFQEKMAEANANGIDVEEDFTKLGSYLNINSKARFILRKEIGENEDSNAHVFGNEHSLFVKNHKTGMMFFAFFD